MRNLDTPVKQIRRKIFTEIAKIGFESTDESMIHDIESIPYNIVEERAKYRESIYRERAVASERVRLAMGLSLRPENRSVHLTDGVKASNIDEKYYEPPLMQVIPSACSACESNKYEVSNMCRGCVAHPCLLTCPKGAISMVNGKSFIDQDKCIHCGRCKAVCPYDAIAHKERPCERACGVKAIESDEQGRASINQDKCVSCGMCIVNCPFGAISDKGQIFQLIQSIKRGDRVFAAVAPAFVGQLGPKVTPERLKAAMKRLGFADVAEVAVGADLCTIDEAEDFVKKVPAEQPFMATSCCPAFVDYIKKNFPAMADKISSNLSPMGAVGKFVKATDPTAKVVFIGPCTAKKMEFQLPEVSPYVDSVLTFEELHALFEACEIDLTALEEDVLDNASYYGRIFARSGGLSDAVAEAFREQDIKDFEAKPVVCNGIEECKLALLKASRNLLPGNFIEGMACINGCIGGAGCLTHGPKDKNEVDEYGRLALEKTIESAAGIAFGVSPEKE